MDRKIVWTEKASGDIEAIFRYIARRDPGAASRIGLGIYDRAQILLEHPEAGTVLDELRDGPSSAASSVSRQGFSECLTTASGGRLAPSAKTGEYE